MLMEADTTALARPTVLPAAPGGSSVAVHSGPVAPNAEAVDVQTANVREALEERLAELRAEHRELVADITTQERGLLVPDAGDDVVDIGTKAFNREQEISLANAVLERIDQVERALERLDEGGYGWCEGCAEPIPPARLAVYPSATLCVTCKQANERR
ncbi:TraR/DksA family transcriptional regulator [Planosporangium sp. 12N6]|uniref:TraR/DksA family transcriptional regulator n=1 Tax=Planosporangium spinosum TaxID=3402278 RepID=UPI003CF97A0A